MRRGISALIRVFKKNKYGIQINRIYNFLHLTCGKIEISRIGVYRVQSGGAFLCPK